MTLIAFENGGPVFRDGKVGTEQGCCCGCCAEVVWHRVHGECNNLPDDFVFVDVDEDCYAYYTWEDWECQEPLVGRDCGAGGQCNIYARVKVTGNTPGQIEYLQSENPDVWGPETPGGFCDCPGSFGSLEVACKQCSETADCQQPDGYPNCADILPAYPSECCNGRCRQWSCYPGALITLEFRKKVGCTAPFLAGIAEGEEFEIVAVDDGLICQDSARRASVPCNTSWTMSAGCAVTDVAFSTVGLPVCEACYEFLGWSSCRDDCNGGCL